MNELIAVARLSKDPEIRYGANNKAVATYSVAIGRKYKRDGEPDADFFNCISFGKTAEVIEKYVKKGTKLVIQGEVQNDNYTAKDGHKVYGTKIIVNQIEFCESKSNAGETEHHTTDKNGFMNIPDEIPDDLPFN